jgi:ABC-type multidrug transport system fused ATPase/permease subunit
VTKYTFWSLLSKNHCSIACLAAYKLISYVGLTYWSKDTVAEQPSHTFGYYAGIYALLQACGLISVLLLAITLWVFAIKRAGANLHHDALQTVLRAPLQFFATTDTGVITNLFSQDINLVDTELPEATLNTLFCVSSSLRGSATTAQ